jgi:hypothetical protein
MDRVQATIFSNEFYARLGNAAARMLLPPRMSGMILCSSVRSAALTALVIIALHLPISTFAGHEELKVNFVSNGIGIAPADFEFWQTGGGEAGKWAVVRDATAVAEAAIEQFSTDKTEDRFPLAIYLPASLKNVAVSARFTLIEGTMQTVGLAVRLITPGNYYVVAANALEQRVDLYRFVDGKRQRIAGVDAPVTRRRWLTLKVIAEEDRFTVLLDAKRLLTALDSGFLNEGRIALWTEEDNVTRFEEIIITALPSRKAP